MTNKKQNFVTGDSLGQRDGRLRKKEKLGRWDRVLIFVSGVSSMDLILSLKRSRDQKQTHKS